MTRKQTLITATLIFMALVHAQAKTNIQDSKNSSLAKQGGFDNSPYDPTYDDSKPTLINYNSATLDDSDSSVDQDDSEIIMNIDSQGAISTEVPLPPSRPDFKDEHTTEEKKTTPHVGTEDDESVADTSSFINAWIKAGVPERALRNALEQLRNDIKRTAVVAVSRGTPALAVKKTVSVSNRRYLIINDFTRPSTEKRMFLLDFKTGNVTRSLVAHGDGTGLLKALNFALANKDGRHQTTPGFHVIAEIYSGKHGLSYALDGLEDRNSQTRSRLVVIHGAPKYATQSFINRKGYLGRSNGCPAVPPETMKILLGSDYSYNSKINMGKGYLTGAMLYNYTILDAK